ncbi:Flagellar motor switch protein FliM [Ralstonia wenshanensis]|uniref:flagellar motor switch protein FliM n=1 Tax=Ralstonia wenshanensis TaxID=2842456 RepID=UPI0028F4D90A|nr:flagellar motor switch protein FliM [Ralstonia wenshanensis]CAJ0815627.1 Flagellar motor switch protein FliM [Ralstonia wenshanensis]
MLKEEFLSQEEIDALLKGVSNDADDDPVEAADPSGIRSYNLGSQERIVRGRMPTLEIINERFARNWRIGLFNFMRRNAEISVGPVKVQKYSEFIRNLVVPTSLNLVHVKPLRGTALFVFDPNLIFLVVDNLFGGDGRFHMRVEGRDFTDVEQRIIQRMLHLVFEHYAKAWQPVYPIDFEFLRMEMHTEFANVATPNEVVITTSFSIELGNNGGDVHICMPYTMIEPIRDRLTSAIQGEALEVDKRWLRLLSQQVQTAEVELIADLATAKVQVSDILNMKVGDVIPLELDDSVTAKVDGVPVMECNYGTFNGQYALRVNRMLNMSGSDAATESDDDN